MKAVTQCFSLSSSSCRRVANDGARHNGADGAVVERDDPWVGWLGQKWAEKAEQNGPVPRKGSAGHKEEWAAKANFEFKSRI
jgi:hypothetical protein